MLDSLLIGLLCRGHVLMLGLPGLGKTLMARTIARALDMDFQRIQFTPDLMPTDITGTDIIEEDPQTGRRTLEFQQGPLFTHFLLADEINRAPPKTQAALLQAMQELEVSVGRRTYKLAPPFFVVATQNPIEQEGTYPLPEAQLDRFMFNVPVDYPTPEEESQIVKSTTTTRQAEVTPVLTAEEIVRLQELVRGVPVADAVVQFAVNLVGASRPGYWRRKQRDSQVHPLRRQSAGDAVLDSGSEGPSDPQRAVSRRLCRCPRRRGACAAAPAGAELPRPCGEHGRGQDHRPVAAGDGREAARRETEPMSSAYLKTAARRLVDPEFFVQIEDLSLVARTVVEGFLHGLHRSPYVGFSLEFASHREYLPGDDLRHLNWKVFARQDKLYVKQYDAETNLDLHLLMDWSGSMSTGQGMSKLRYAACLAAAIAHLGLLQHDAVGLTLFANTVLEHLEPRAKSSQLTSILNMLVQVPPRPHGESAQGAARSRRTDAAPRAGGLDQRSVLRAGRVVRGAGSFPVPGSRCAGVSGARSAGAASARVRVDPFPRFGDGGRGDDAGGRDPGRVPGGDRPVVCGTGSRLPHAGRGSGGVDDRPAVGRCVARVLRTACGTPLKGLVAWRGWA